MDIILYTQDEFNERGQSKSFEPTIAKEGVRVYAKEC